jgi:hypothetical protein
MIFPTVNQFSKEFALHLLVKRLTLELWTVEAHSEAVKALPEVKEAHHGAWGLSQLS